MNYAKRLSLLAALLAILLLFASSVQAQNRISGFGGIPLDDKAHELSFSVSIGFLPDFGFGFGSTNAGGPSGSFGANGCDNILINPDGTATASLHGKFVTPGKQVIPATAVLYAKPGTAKTGEFGLSVNKASDGTPLMIVPLHTLDTGTMSVFGLPTGMGSLGMLPQQAFAPALPPAGIAGPPQTPTNEQQLDMIDGQAQDLQAQIKQLQSVLDQMKKDREALAAKLTEKAQKK